MIDFFKKPYRWAMIFTGLMIGAFAFVMLDTFVIPKSYQMIASEGDTGEGEDTDSENEQP
ncbi:MAG: hypothetical protein K0S04_3042, partial [Herbinix sp.]|nr:hypothetical protein [Herbinix sp.]